MVAEVGLQVDFVEKPLCARSLCPLRLLPGLKTIDPRLLSSGLLTQAINVYRIEIN